MSAEPDPAIILGIARCFKSAVADGLMNPKPPRWTLAQSGPARRRRGLEFIPMTIKEVEQHAEVKEAQSK